MGKGIKGQGSQLSFAAWGARAFEDGKRAKKTPRSARSSVTISGNPLNSARMDHYSSVGLPTVDPLSKFPSSQLSAGRPRQHQTMTGAFPRLLSLGPFSRGTRRLTEVAQAARSPEHSDRSHHLQSNGRMISDIPKILSERVATAAALHVGVAGADDGTAGAGKRYLARGAIATSLGQVHPTIGYMPYSRSMF